MKTKKLLSILLIVIIMLQSCGQKSDKQIIKEIMEKTEIPKKYKKEPFYYAYLYHANIDWVMDINEARLFDHYGGNVSSMNAPLNYNILEKGKQKLTIKIFPPKGEKTLGKYASLRMRLYYNKNFRDRKDPEIDILTFQLPEEGIEDLPYFEKTFEFNADVPYKITGCTNSKDLTKIPDLEKKVLAKIEELKKILENQDTEAYMKAISAREKNRYICLYATKEEIEKNIKGKTFSEYFKESKDIEILPIKDYKIVLEANNRIVKLVQPQWDGFIDGINYKAIKIETGGLIEGGYMFRFHIPENSTTNELEVL